MPKGTKDIENKIIEYIIHLKKQGMSYYGISNYTVPVKSFYAINDVTLNVKKIAKFMPEIRKVKADQPYEHEEISKLLSIADERMKVVILVLASFGTEETDPDLVSQVYGSPRNRVPKEEGASYLGQD